MLLLILWISLDMPLSWAIRAASLSSSSASCTGPDMSALSRIAAGIMNDDFCTFLLPFAFPFKSAARVASAAMGSGWPS